MMGNDHNIRMVDLIGQQERIKEELDRALSHVMESCYFIKGPVVKAFEEHLADYLGIKEVIGCANGTDALQIALMALPLEPGDEIIVPAFTYAATAEVAALLGYKPVIVDVDKDTFNINLDQLRHAIGPKTRVIIPVHLYGLTSRMEEIMQIANDHNLYVVEDNAQAIGADYIYDDGRKVKSGTMGHIGCTSFFPSKNLGCYGDGGAVMTNDQDLADKMRRIANHGQTGKYIHGEVGINSRLDSLQAAVLDVKLKHLDDFIADRQKAACFYDSALGNIPGVVIPGRPTYSTHVFHQYTLQVQGGKRNELKTRLDEKGIPSTIYYPLPLYRQVAYKGYWDGEKLLPNTEVLCQTVLSLPMHTELTENQLEFICENVGSFLS